MSLASSLTSHFLLTNLPKPGPPGPETVAPATQRVEAKWSG